MNIFKIFGFFALVLVVIAGISGFIWKKNCDSFLKNTLVTGEYIIEKGASYPQIYDIVFGKLDTPKGFKLYLSKVRKVSAKMHYGYYSADNTSLEELLQNITRGKQTLVKVTFPEGYNMYDVATTLENACICGRQAALDAFRDEKLIQKLTGGNYKSLEGFLSPGTYFFSKGYPAEKVAGKMVSEFYATLPPDFEVLAAEQGLDFYEALTLASIVQKETYSEAEAPLVAAVFLNRIKRKMLLQADPTIIYGIYEGFDGNIRKVDIRESSNPYNTYKHRGLTPTPIANPSSIALNAVINPADVDYFYFVATKNGEHVFAKSYEEHLRNVNIHQRGRN